MKDFIERLAAAALIFFSLPFVLLPLALSRRLGRLLGAVVYFIWVSRRRIAIENIRLSNLCRSVDASLTARKSFENLGESFAEIAKIRAGLGRKVLENIRIEGIDNFLEAAAEGRGAISITGHCGNWEVMALSSGIQIKTISVVARRQNNIYIDGIVEKMRTKYGNKVIYKKGALKQILSAVKANENVGILMDQAVSENEGYVVNFLGRPAWTTKMPALIARRTGAAVLPVFIRREGSGHVIMILPPVKLSDADGEQAVIDDTIVFNSYIENYIRCWPEEWLWIHKRWKRAAQDDKPVALKS
ncbi:MAG: lysophospholipid acyltransferase family protein [Dissulfurispiraceae bacterium]|jgi:KDO2-lipid IV(A) lauroyltransferase|nr:lysophospholipid acyltransferase family protein [Dissulfurispiraceae bacterium]